jgi:phosphate transport system permease protein
MGLRVLAGAAALLVAVTLVLIAYQVADQASDAISAFGLGFITSAEWNAVTNQFGALDLIWGTAVTSLIALVLAVPIAIAIGLFLSELAPRRLRAPVGALVELLAAIPSVVLGLWGILVMGPFLQAHVEPWLNDHLGFITLFSGTPSNVGLLPASLVLTIMVVPIVASISRELFDSVPGDLKAGSLALGSTRWEMVRSVPSRRSAPASSPQSSSASPARSARPSRSARRSAAPSAGRRRCSARQTPWRAASPTSTRAPRRRCRRRRSPTWR